MCSIVFYTCAHLEFNFFIMTTLTSHILQQNRAAKVKRMLPVTGNILFTFAALFCRKILVCNSYILHFATKSAIKVDVRTQR